MVVLSCAVCTSKYTSACWTGSNYLNILEIHACSMPLYSNTIVSTCSIPHHIRTERRLTLLASCEPWQHVDVVIK